MKTDLSVQLSIPHITISLKQNNNLENVFNHGKYEGVLLEADWPRFKVTKWLVLLMFNVLVN